MKGIDKEKWNRFTPESTMQRCTVLFYTHFLYAKNPVSYKFSVPVFQSTPSAWRVTGHHGFGVRQRGISIHTLRMEGDALMVAVQVEPPISIHTLRMEGDCAGADGRPPLAVRFQSTPSAWRVTFMIPEATAMPSISIHTLRMEGDCKSAQKIGTLLFKSNRPAEKLPTGRA